MSLDGMATAPFRLDVFSSRTGQWEDRSFVREGESVGTVEDVRRDVSKRMGSTTRRRCAVYRRRVLYVHYHRDFIMRYTSMHKHNPTPHKFLPILILFLLCTMAIA
jgi:hypothetical protein